MREAVTIERMVGEHALVRLVSKSVLERREFTLVRIQYDRRSDWEVGVVEQIGAGDWDPLEVGDHVLVRAGGVHEQSGGPAGADVSVVLGERRGTHIVIAPHEVVTIVRLDD